MIQGLKSFTSPTLVSPYAPKPVAPQQTAAASSDGVTLSGQQPAAPSVATPAAAPESVAKRSAFKSMVVGLALTASMAGLTGCASMQMQAPMLPNVNQMVTGSTTKSAFTSISYLDSVSSRQGGGIYHDRVSDENRLRPLEAVDRMMDGKPIIYQAEKDGKTHPIRSWAELKGLEDMVRQQQGSGGAPVSIQQPQ